MSQQINLFNPIFLKQKKHFSAWTMLQGLVLVLVGSILVAVYARFQLAALESQASSTSAQLAQTKAQLAKVSAEYPPRQKSRALAEELRQLETDLTSQRQVMATMQRGEFGNEEGYAEYMRAFSRQIVDGLWLTGFSINGAGADIELRGRSLRPELVPVYIGRLRQEQSMRGKSFAHLVMATPEQEKSEPRQAQSDFAETRPLPRYIEFTLRSSDPPAKSGPGLGPAPLGAPPR